MAFTVEVFVCFFLKRNILVWTKRRTALLPIVAPSGALNYSLDDFIFVIKPSFDLIQTLKSFATHRYYYLYRYFTCFYVCCSKRSLMLKPDRSVPLLCPPAAASDEARILAGANSSTQLIANPNKAFQFMFQWNPLQICGNSSKCCSISQLTHSRDIVHPPFW